MTEFELRKYALEMLPNLVYAMKSDADQASLHRFLEPDLREKFPGLSARGRRGTAWILVQTAAQLKEEPGDLSPDRMAYAYREAVCKYGVEVLASEMKPANTIRYLFVRDCLAECKLFIMAQEGDEEFDQFVHIAVTCAIHLQYEMYGRFLRRTMLDIWDHVQCQYEELGYGNYHIYAEMDTRSPVWGEVRKHNLPEGVVWNPTSGPEPVYFENGAASMSAARKKCAGRVSKAGEGRTDNGAPIIEQVPCSRLATFGRFCAACARTQGQRTPMFID